MLIHTYCYVSCISATHQCIIHLPWLASSRRVGIHMPTIFIFRDNIFREKWVKKKDLCSRHHNCKGLILTEVNVAKSNEIFYVCN